jgi:hypothetical protein
MLERLYASLSLRRMCEKLDCSFPTVLYRLRKHGIRRRSRGGPNHCGRIVLKELHPPADATPMTAEADILPIPQEAAKPAVKSFSMRVDEWRKMNGL